MKVKKEDFTDFPSKIHNKIKETDEEIDKILKTESAITNSVSEKTVTATEDESTDDFDESVSSGSSRIACIPASSDNILARRERAAFNYVLPFILKAQTYRIILFSIITAILAALEFHFTEKQDILGNDEIEIIYQPSKALAGIFSTIGFLLAVLTQKPYLGLPYVSVMLFISTTNYFELIKMILFRYGNGLNLSLVNLVWLVFFFSTDLSLVFTASKILYYEWITRCMKSCNQKLYELDDFCKKNKLNF
ncbi:uncharacterized protein LOC123296348 [Chrysoperla carnea]|uniref:uncharacterized protein LOC123296348 n=1 Tax=Chrysoperla carnea TaxID=189513 RepID=UPI001D08814F|nr:uncharacterized protein LOC123296348 [Chrysoperla carnea]